MAPSRLEDTCSGESITATSNAENEFTGHFSRNHENTADDEMDDGSDQDGDEDAVAGPATNARVTSQKRRADVAAFDRWIEENQEQLSEPRKKGPRGTEKSLGGLASDVDREKIITSPRDYQIELFEKAKQQNTIAVLDTGRYQIPDPPWPRD